MATQRTRATTEYAKLIHDIPRRYCRECERLFRIKSLVNLQELCEVLEGSDNCPKDRVDKLPIGTFQYQPVVFRPSLNDTVYAYTSSALLINVSPISICTIGSCCHHFNLMFVWT